MPLAFDNLQKHVNNNHDPYYTQRDFYPISSFHGNMTNKEHQR